ncbi:MAG: helix-turn-helix domain-containing protein [Cryomorphaceae bacterium]|jgi:hypothetical protein|nr:helix-turn-helix domain-containing protein [Cryomorphaceae bacterium]
MTQNDIIKNHLKNHKTITTLQAFSMYGITRLASRILELRESGMKISGYMIDVKNRRGEIVKVKKYYVGK